MLRGCLCSMVSIAGLALLDETVYFLFAKQLRDSGLPADVLVGKLKKDRQAGRPSAAPQSFLRSWSRKLGLASAAVWPY